MKLVKKLNNSTAIARDTKGAEYILMGNGLVFGLDKDSDIDMLIVDRMFSSSDPDKQLLLDLVNSIPETYFNIAHEIVEYAQAALDDHLSDSIYITLTDHIYFLHKRYEENMVFRNPLKWEIKKYYTKEFEIGLKAVELLEEEFNFELLDDEAAVVAMHIVNASTNGDMRESTNSIELIDGIMQTIKLKSGIEIDEDDISFQRLLTHLKFFIQRINAKEISDVDNPLFLIVKDRYKRAFDIALSVKDLVERNTDYSVSENELTYFCIHIQRLIERKK